MGSLGLVVPCWNPALTSSLSLPLQGLPGVPGKRGKMGRPVKIFRVYYADSMGELDLPLATSPCPPVAWARSACFSVQPSLCFECVGRRVGLPGPRVLPPERGVAASWLRLGSCGLWVPLGWTSVCAPSALQCVLCLGVGEGSAVWVISVRAGGPARMGGSWLGQVLVLLTQTVSAVLGSPTPPVHTRGQRAVGCWAGPQQA